jgi:carboxylesterase
LKRNRADSPARAGGAIRAGCEEIRLEGSSDRAVLLLHGFGDTPQTLCYLAADLHADGFTVHAPLLPGHGRSVPDFARSTSEDWVAEARAALRALTTLHPNVGVAGLSMGGALATLLAAEMPDVRALALIAPYFDMPRWLAVASLTGPLWGRMVGEIGSGTTRSIRNPEERARNLGYGRTTGRLLHELWLLARRARRALPLVQAPTLLIQSRDDNRISPRVVERAYSRLGSAEKRLVLTEGAGHIITVDYGRTGVSAEVRGWFRAHLGAGIRSAT